MWFEGGPEAEEESLVGLRVQPQARERPEVLAEQRRQLAGLEERLGAEGKIMARLQERLQVEEDRSEADRAQAAVAAARGAAR